MSTPHNAANPGDFAKTVLMPGDPLRAKFVAENFLEDPKLVKVVKLDEVCREQQVHDGCFAAIDEVPTHALSVTIPGLCGAKWMFCSVPAATKAEAVKHVLNDEISTACPATILRVQKHAFLYLDADSGSKL